MSLEEQINNACANLPPNYQILLTMENGSAWIETYNIRTGKTTDIDREDRSLAEQIKDTVQFLQEDYGDYANG